MMDGVRRLMLQNQREIIVRDLDVQFILDDLYSKNVINQDEKELILSEVWILFVFFFNILQTKFIILFFFLVMFLFKVAQLQHAYTYTYTLTLRVIKISKCSYYKTVQFDTN